MKNLLKCWQASFDRPGLSVPPQQVVAEEAPEGCPRMKWRLLDRYVFREVLAPTLTALPLFTFLFFIPQLVRLMQLLVGPGTHLGDVVKLIFALLPNILSLALPVALLLGTLLGLGRLSVDGEILAVNASGIGRRRLLVPVGYLACLVFFLTLIDLVWIEPATLRAFHQIEDRLTQWQGALEVEPRVFEENFPGRILYIEDVTAGGTRWRNIFLAQTDADGQMEVTLAKRAVLVPQPRANLLQIHLEDGVTYGFNPVRPEQYALTTFAASDLALSADTGAKPQRRETVAEKGTFALMREAGADGIEARVELHRRFAIPVACLVFGVLGFVLSLRVPRKGRAAAIVLALIVLASYYLLFVFGMGRARQGTLLPGVGVWLADVVMGLTAAAGLLGLEQTTQSGLPTRWVNRIREATEWLARRWRQKTLPPSDAQVTPLTQHAPRGVLLLLDGYVLRRFAFFTLSSLVAFVLLVNIFTFFELLNDIVRHHIPLAIVAKYLFFLTPMLIYQLTPLAALVSALATIATMDQQGELVACRACGISLYRVTAPLLVGAGLLGTALFLLDSRVLPFTNQRQDALRNLIKGRPAQTFFQPRARWIVGEDNQIYNYGLFDPDHNVLGELNLFRLDQHSFRLVRQVFARRAHWEPALSGWVLEDGWVRDFTGDTVVRFAPFVATSLPDLREPPGYFRQEVRLSSQMNWRELGRYIAHLRKAGFDTARLSVQWQKKFAFPAALPVMVLLAVPFPMLFRTRGTLGGLAVGLLIGICYWALAALCEALGAVGQLPAPLAAWVPNGIFFFVGLYFYLKMPT